MHPGKRVVVPRVRSRLQYNGDRTATSESTRSRHIDLLWRALPHTFLVQVPCCASDVFWLLSLKLIFTREWYGWVTGTNPHDQRARSTQLPVGKTSGLSRPYEENLITMTSRLLGVKECLIRSSWLPWKDCLSCLMPSKLKRLDSPVTSELARLLECADIRGFSHQRGNTSHHPHAYFAKCGNYEKHRQEAIVRGRTTQTLCTWPRICSQHCKPLKGGILIPTGAEHSAHRQ